MTDSPQSGPGQLSPEALEAAEAELAQVRSTLEGAARGETSPAEVKDTLQSYMTEHGPALQAAAAAVGEETRRQTLEQLYQWRAQLAAQREAREAGKSHRTTDGTA